MDTDFYYAMGLSDGNIAGIVRGPYLYVECPADTDDRLSYINVDERKVYPKREFNFQTTVDGLTVLIEDLPDGTRVTANGQHGVVTDGSVFIEFDVPGHYEIGVGGVAELLDTVVEVTLNEA